MKKLLSIAVALAVLCAILILVIRSRGTETATVSTPPEANPPPGVVLAPVESPPPAEPREAPTRHTVALTARDSQPPNPSASDGLAEVRGRFLLPDGSPASGVAVEVHGWAGNSDRALKFGEAKDWKDPSPTSSADDGRFSVRLDPPLAFQFTLDGRLAGYCKESWRWNDLPSGKTTDLGDVVLRRGGGVTGKIIDAAGRPLRQAWVVYAAAGDAGKQEGKEPVREHAALDAQSGEFRIADLSPGPIKLTAYLKIAGWIDGPSVDVHAGELAHVDIQYAGPDIASRITVVVSTRPFHTFSHDVQEIVLRGEGIEPRKARKDERSSQSWNFDEVSPGRYTIEIQDPKFLAWSQSDVEPGTSVDAKLKGNAGVRLSVLDASSGDPVAHYTAKVRFDNANWFPNTFALIAVGSEPPADGLIDGMIPADQTIIVSAEGFADCSVAVSGLQPNEIRPLTARLSQGASLSGIVVRGAKKLPVPRVNVSLAHPPPTTSGTMHLLPGRDDPLTQSVQTDDAGRFTFASLPAGTYDLIAEWTPRLKAEVDSITLGASDVRQDVELLLPDVASLHGRVLGPDGAGFENLTLLMTPAAQEAERAAGRSLHFSLWIPQDKASIPLGPDGSYRVSPLIAGDTHVELLCPHVRLPTSFNSWSGHGGPVIDLGRIVLEPDTDTEHDFDLRASFPGSVRLAVTLAGAPAAGIVAELWGTNEYAQAESAAILDDSGRARLGPLPPNDYRLLARSVDTSWFYFAPTRVKIVADVESDVALDVPLVDGDLQVLDVDSGEPFASPQLLIRLDGDPRSPAVAIATDAKGAHHLRMPPARYSLGLGHDSPQQENAERVPFDWTDKGPVPPVVKLHRAKEQR